MFAQTAIKESLTRRDKMFVTYLVNFGIENGWFDDLVEAKEKAVQNGLETAIIFKDREKDKGIVITTYSPLGGWR
jgi:hypothetical protein